jgi:hypothetical protein
MLLRLRGDNGLLYATEKLLRLSQRQTKVRNLTKVAELSDLQYVDAPSRLVSSHLHQANNPPHPRSPTGNGPSGRIAIVLIPPLSRHSPKKENMG